MAAAELLAVGTSALSSADLVVAAGTPVTVGLKLGASDANPALIRITIKDDTGAYLPIGVLDQNNPVLVIAGPGTYKFTRPAGVGSCGVFSA